MNSFALAAALSTAICLAAYGQAEPTQPADPARAEWLATGGNAWDSLAAVVLAGTMTEGGVPGKFEKTIDLRTGHSRTVQETGPMRALRGYDGMAWSAENGIVNSVDLPPLVADARSQAFVDRAGWRDKDAQTVRSELGSQMIVAHYMPPGGSAVEVSFDPKSHLVTQIAVQTDDGPLTTTYSGWRSIGKVKFAFRQIQTGTVGEVTTLEIKQVRLLHTLSADAVARPKRTPHGRLLSAGDARVPFTYVGSHIFISAKVNDVDAKVIFDTGAANYFAPASARRFGLEVSGGLNLSGVGESSTTGGFAKVSKISVGSAELRDEAVVVAPTPFGQQGGGPDGFVGFEFLSEFRTIIDYPAKTITFTEFGPAPPTPAVKVPFYSDGHSIYVEADVDNQPGLFRLDTGDGGTVTLFPTFAKLHNLYQGTGENVASGGGVGGKVLARPVTLTRFTVAATDFFDLPARLSQNTAGAFASRSLAGNLGGGILRCFRITFDYAARTLTFELDVEHPHDCAASLRN